MNDTLFATEEVLNKIIKERTEVAFTFGNFDGVHLGHRYLLQKSNELCLHLPLVALTFQPHPATFFHPENPKPLLCSLSERIDLLKKANVSLVIVTKFNNTFANLSADDFCQQWLKKQLNVKAVLYGHDLCYGKNRLGTAAHMRSYCQQQGIQFFAISPCIIKNENISSSLIRKHLAAGEMQEVQALLGRPYTLSGTVMHGAKRGQKIGFPTANLDCDTEDRALPKYGVYACLVNVKGKSYQGVVNCGLRPTVADPRLKVIHIEPHLFDFNEDIYHQEITVQFIKYIREEKKFNSLEELKKQICLDVEMVKNFYTFNHTPPQKDAP